MSELLARITTNPAIFHGKPIIRGMRVRVVDVLELLRAGLSHAEILAELPYLEAADIEACLVYAMRQLDHPVLSV